MSSILADRRRNEQGEVDYYCPKNHHVYGDNIVWRENGKGKKHPGCKECRRKYRQGYFSRDDVRERYSMEAERKALANVAPVYDSNGNVIPWETYLGMEKRSVPWNLLRPRAEASAQFDDFNEALKITPVPCRGRADEFTEYTDPRPGRDEEDRIHRPMPGREQARLMCEPCPLLEMCRDYAHADRMEFGIWAGERWLGGKVV